jgi:Zn-dependent protease/CBS domain-containing protein
MFAAYRIPPIGSMMFGKRITLFKLFGFDVRADASWLIIVALITWTLSAGVFQNEYPGLPGLDYWLMGITGALALFASVVVHELFHSLVARVYGLPMKGITLFIFGGVAEMEDEPPNAKAEFMMAIAGPAASILIGIVFYIVHRSALLLWPVQVVGVLGYLYWINWILALFNLIPAFPLDGGRVLRSILWWHWKGDLPRATRIASSIGSGFGIVLIAFGVLRLFMGDFISAVWWFLIGMFLRGTSQASYRQVLMRSVLAGEPIQRFMKVDAITVSPDLSVANLVEDYIYRYHHKMFPVVADSNNLLGCVTTNEVKNLSREEWAQHTVREITRPCTEENTAPPETDAQQALLRMTRTGVGRLMVVKENRLIGIISLKDLLGFLSTKLNLEGHGTADRSRFRL